MTCNVPRTMALSAWRKDRHEKATNKIKQYAGKTKNAVRNMVQLGRRMAAHITGNSSYAHANKACSEAVLCAKLQAF